MSDDKNDLTCAPQEHVLLVAVALPLFCPISHSSAALGEVSPDPGDNSKPGWHHPNPALTGIPLSHGDSFRWPSFQSANIYFPALELHTAHPRDALLDATGCKNSKIRARDSKLSWLPQHVFTFNVISQAQP